MQIRTVVSTLALTASMIVPVASHAASRVGRSDNTPTPSTSVAKVKTVKFTLRNKTDMPMTLIVNDAPITLAANQQTEVKAAEGSNILSDDRSTVRVHVTRELGGNTVSFR